MGRQGYIVHTRRPIAPGRIQESSGKLEGWPACFSLCRGRVRAAQLGDRCPQSTHHKRVPILGLLPGFLVFPGQPFQGGLHQRPRGRVLVSAQAVGRGDRRQAHARGGHRLALRLHQGLQVTADVGRACQQAGAPVLETPAGEVLPAGGVGPPSVGEPAAGLRPGVARTLTPTGEVGAPSDASGGSAGVPRSPFQLRLS